MIKGNTSRAGIFGLTMLSLYPNLPIIVPPFGVELSQMYCKFCGKDILENSVFCPSCGKKQLEVEQNITLGKELLIYVMTFVFVPFGLIWFFKYIKSSDGVKKRIAYLTLTITVVATVITVAVTYSYVKSVQSYIQSNNLDQFTELGL